MYVTSDMKNMSYESGNKNSVIVDGANYDEAFELTGHGTYNRLVLVACCIISNAVALDMFGFSVVVAAARCDLAIGMQETGILVSAPFVGLLFAFPWGYFSDRHGRRKALLLSSSVGFLFAAMSSLATSWKVMFALKIIGSCLYVIYATYIYKQLLSKDGMRIFWDFVVITIWFIVTIAFLGECTGAKRRSQYLSVMNSINLASEIVSFSLAYFILPLTFNIPLPWPSVAFSSWRLYTLVLALPLGVGALLMSLLFESPKFLANAGQTDKALDVMKKINAINNGKKNDYSVRSLKKVEAESEVSFWKSVVRQTVPLFKRPLLWRTLQLFFLMAVCCSTNNVFFMWFPTMVNIFFNSLDQNSGAMGFCQRIKDEAALTIEHEQIGLCDDTLSLNAIYSGLMLGIFLTVLNLVVSRVASYRRLVLISLFLLAGASCLLVGLLQQPLVSLLFFALIQTTAVGLGCIASYFVDLYPTSYRGSATSLGVMVGRLTSFGGVIAIGNVITVYCNLTFYFWTILTLCGVGVALLLPSDKQTNVVVQT